MLMIVEKNTENRYVIRKTNYDEEIGFLNDVLNLIGSKKTKSLSNLKDLIHVWIKDIKEIEEANLPIIEMEKQKGLITSTNDKYSYITEEDFEDIKNIRDIIFNKDLIQKTEKLKKELLKMIIDYPEFWSTIFSDSGIEKIKKQKTKNLYYGDYKKNYALMYCFKNYFNFAKRVNFDNLELLEVGKENSIIKNKGYVIFLGNGYSGTSTRIKNNSIVEARIYTTKEVAERQTEKLSSEYAILEVEINVKKVLSNKITVDTKGIDFISSSLEKEELEKTIRPNRKTKKLAM